MKIDRFEIILFLFSIFFLSILVLHYGPIINPDTFSYSVYAKEIVEGNKIAYAYNNDFLSAANFYYMVVPKPFQIFLSLIALSIFKSIYSVAFVYIFFASLIILYSYKIIKIYNKKAALISPLLLLFNTQFILSAVKAGSITIFLALIFPIIYYLIAWDGKKKANIIIISLLLFLASLTRPEAWFLIFPIFLFFFIKKSKKKMSLILIPLSVFLASAVWFTMDYLFSKNFLWSLELSKFAKLICVQEMNLGLFKFFPYLLLQIYLSLNSSALLIFFSLMGFFFLLKADIKNIFSPLITFPIMVSLVYLGITLSGGLFVPRFIFIASFIMVITAGLGIFYLLENINQFKKYKLICFIAIILLLIPSYLIPFLPESINNKLDITNPASAILKKESIMQNDIKLIADFLDKKEGKILAPERRIPQFDYIYGLDYTRFYSFRRMAYLNKSLEEMNIKYIVYSKEDIPSYVYDYFSYLDDRERKVIGNSEIIPVYSIDDITVFMVDHS